MKKKIVGASIITIAVVTGLMITNIFASSTTPGSTSDPLVSKSYVDQKIMEAMSTGSINNSGSTGSASGASNDEIISQVVKQMETLYGEGLGGGSAKYEPVSASTGQIIVCGEGTELILRSGTAKGYIPGGNGIVNATDGSEIFNNTPVAVNNLLIVPRDDGRGVYIESDAWFIIKGSYNIVSQ